MYVSGGSTSSPSTQKVTHSKIADNVKVSFEFEGHNEGYN